MGCPVRIAYIVCLFFCPSIQLFVSLCLCQLSLSTVCLPVCLSGFLLSILHRLSFLSFHLSVCRMSSLCLTGFLSYVLSSVYSSLHYSLLRVPLSSYSMSGGMLLSEKRSRMYSSVPPVEALLLLHMPPAVQGYNEVYKWYNSSDDEYTICFVGY